ncbi:unnamed protein product [Owenia fusiformis]|uniref:Uncharacterized protein n=1 Tax=Owenia fusiformis TaxID=6347 RepID=A0A8J1TEN3_OWEFU|nr:unnamed protein product [Owenia fusiformis]
MAASKIVTNWQVSYDHIWSGVVSVNSILQLANGTEISENDLLDYMNTSQPLTIVDGSCYTIEFGNSLTLVPRACNESYFFVCKMERGLFDDISSLSMSNWADCTIVNCKVPTVEPVATTEAITTEATTKAKTTEATTEVTTEGTTEVITTEATTEGTTEVITTEATTEGTTEVITTEATTEGTTTEGTTEATTEGTTEVITTEATTEGTTEVITTEATTEGTTEVITTEATTEGTTEVITTEATTEGTTEVITTEVTTEATTEGTTEAITTQATTEGATEAITTEVITTEETTKATTEATTEAITTEAISTEATTEAITTEATTTVKETTKETTEEATSKPATELTTTEILSTEATTLGGTTEATTEGTTEATTETTTENPTDGTTEAQVLSTTTTSERYGPYTVSPLYYPDLYINLHIGHGLSSGSLVLKNTTQTVIYFYSPPIGLTETECRQITLEIIDTVNNKAMYLEYTNSDDVYTIPYEDLNVTQAALTLRFYNGNVILSSSSDLSIENYVVFNDSYNNSLTYFNKTPDSNITMMYSMNQFEFRTTGDANTILKCPPFSTLIDDYCYGYMYNYKTYEDAFSYCDDHNGSVALLNDYILKQLADSKIISDWQMEAGYQIWTGVISRNTSFKLANGSEIARSDLMEFMNISQNLTTDNDSCYTIETGNSFTLVPRNCDDDFFYVCRIEKGYYDDISSLGITDWAAGTRGKCSAPVAKHVAVGKERYGPYIVSPLHHPDLYINLHIGHGQSSGSLLLRNTTQTVVYFYSPPIGLLYTGCRRMTLEVVDTVYNTAAYLEYSNIAHDVASTKYYEDLDFDRAAFHVSFNNGKAILSTSYGLPHGFEDYVVFNESYGDAMTFFNKTPNTNIHLLYSMYQFEFKTTGDANTILKCPPFSVPIDDFCYGYMLFCKTYQEAFEYCDDHNGSLALLNDHILEEMAASNIVTNWQLGYKQIWSGVTYKDSKLQLANGTEISENDLMDYMNTSRPLTIVDGSCYTIQFGNSLTLVPRACNESYFFVCKMERGFFDDVSSLSWTGWATCHVIDCNVPVPVTRGEQTSPALSSIQTFTTEATTEFTTEEMTTKTTAEATTAATTIATTETSTIKATIEVTTDEITIKATTVVTTEILEVMTETTTTTIAAEANTIAEIEEIYVPAKRIEHEPEEAPHAAAVGIPPVLTMFIFLSLVIASDLRKIYLDIKMGVNNILSRVRNSYTVPAQ